MLRQSRKRYESRQVHSAASRSVLVPAVPEAFVYDADGNLLRDGLWIYEWDADGARQRGDGAPKARPQGCRVRVPLGWTRQQNRLIAQELRSDVSTATWKRLEYKYDREGRRVQKLVKTRSTVGGSWTTASDTRFLYDGWNLIAEYSYTGSTFTLLRSHVWGLDLSGTPQGAGGVGGLLWTTVAATSKTYIAAADANGNVIAYVDSADGIVAGKRDYGAFGEAVITTGVAGSLPFGFSSKYEEKESGLYYYGMRFYAPSTGRWPNRDPIGERGGVNLYGIVANNPVNRFDYLGLWDENGGYDYTEFQKDWSKIDSGPPYLMPGADVTTGIPIQCNLVAEPVKEANILSGLFDSCKCRKICIYHCYRKPIYRLMPGPSMVVEGVTVPTYQWEPSPLFSSKLIKVLRVKGDCNGSCPAEETLYTNPRESFRDVEPHHASEPGSAGSGTVRG